MFLIFTFMRAFKNNPYLNFIIPLFPNIFAVSNIGPHREISFNGANKNAT
jgi:hypothetical protein